MTGGTKRIFKGFAKKDKGSELKPRPQPAPARDYSQGHGDESNWLVSYADMMTLLCGFFIMLFSMARLDEPQFENVKEAVAKQFGGEYRSSSKELAKYVKQVVQELGIESETSIKYDPAGVSITFESTVFFDTLSAEVKPAGQKILGDLAVKISEKEKEEKAPFRIVAEGHTDSRPIRGGIFPTNWELSGARASSVIRLFLEKKYNPKNLIAIGYADTHLQELDRAPSGEWGEAAMSKNRRVVLRILHSKSEAIPFPNGGKALDGPEREPAKATEPTGAVPPKPGAWEQIPVTPVTQTPDSASSAH